MAQTTTELASHFDTTPRTLRKFLRSDESGIESVGKGSRYTLPTAKREVNAMKKRFDAWTASQVKVIDEVPADAPADEPTDEFEADDAELEPTDAELAELDD